MKVFFSKRVLDSCSGNPKSKFRNPKWAGLVAFAVALALCGPVAEAQQQAKIFKIGWLGARPTARDTASIRGSEFIWRDLRAHGYVEGKNIAIEYRSTEGQLDRLSAVADELVRLKVDVLVASATLATLALKNATKTIPIVFLTTADPVAAALVDSLARPGGNLTGFTTFGTELAGKRLELLKETIPGLSRVAVLWNPREPGNAQVWKESLLAAHDLGLQLHSMEIRSENDIKNAFKEAIKARSAALAITQSPLANSNLKNIAELAKNNRLPAIFTRGDFVESGGLMSYGPDRMEPYSRVASMIDKVLKGAKPADIPVEQPMRFELVLNFKTAKALGLTIPPIVLMRVTKVIK